MRERERRVLKTANRKSSRASRSASCLSSARKPQRALIYAYLIEFLLLFAVVQSQRQSKPSFVSFVDALIEYLYDVLAHLQQPQMRHAELEFPAAPCSLFPVPCCVRNFPIDIIKCLWRVNSYGTKLGICGLLK